MWQTVRWTLRQPRYARLAVLALFFALGCIAAGTWQIQRFQQSVHDNDALDHNARAATAPLTPSLVPVTDNGRTASAHPAPGRDAIRFRTVTVTGTYLPSTSYVGGKIVNDTGGFDVVTPLRTSTGTVIVVRGFDAATGADKPRPVPPPPTGTVTVSGRLDTTSTAHSATNPAAVAASLSQPVYQAVLNLGAGQPGSAGLVSPGKPDLSNPAGGAYEAQHFAYIIQWYVFALLALIAPFAIARNEVREAQRRFLGLDAGERDLALEAGAASPGGELVLRSGGALVSSARRDTRELARAKRLADRYGRSLSIGDPVDAPLTAAPLREPTPVGGLSERVADSSVVPHRSHDAYHGSYNDYLWQLGLADGEAPPAPDLDRPLVIDAPPQEPEQPER